MANTTFNPSDKSAGITLSGGNLIATYGGSAGSVRTTDRQVSGKFYWEFTLTTIGGTSSDGFGMISAGFPLGTSWVGNLSTLPALGFSAQSNIWVDGVSTGIGLGTLANGNIACFAVDLDARLVWIRIGAAGNWNANASANPATGVGGISHSLGRGIPAYPAFYTGTTAHSVTANFGDTAFTGAVPSGYTSGFTAGASVPTNALASQALAEHWLTTNPAAQITSVVAEHWASVASGNLQAVVTFVALEHWTSVAVVVPAAGGPQVTMIH